jgi:hypothetical protein
MGWKSHCKKNIDVSATKTKQTTNSVALVRKQTITTERPPLVRKISAKFSG